MMRFFFSSSHLLLLLFSHRDSLRRFPFFYQRSLSIEDFPQTE